MDGYNNNHRTIKAKKRERMALMKMRKFMCVLLICIAIPGHLIAPALATDVPNEGVIRLEDLEYEQVDLSTVELWENGIAPQTIDSINRVISTHSIGAVVSERFFTAESIITFNCSYSPSSASMDFGVIDSNGRFYYTNVKEGSINRTIRISQSGSYQVAIRNNSSQTVRVVGFVEY